MEGMEVWALKKTILIFALSRSPWIGGIYYRKNITRMLITNKNIAEKYKIVVLTNKTSAGVFYSLHPQVDIVSCKDGIGPIRALLQGIRCCLKYKIKYVFPIMPYYFFRVLGITPVSWIADFQHCWYPEFFSQKEINERNRNFEKIAAGKNPLIVSSDSALDDFQRFFSEKRSNVHVVHFTSYIESELQQLSKMDEEKILSGLGIEEYSYIAVCNQFWKHKNHKVVLQAIELIAKQHPEKCIEIVFTGELSDRRNPKYIEEIRDMIDHPLIRNQVKVLGFLDRITQLCVMKYSWFIIQPSLFEGWGTVVEDAKVLQKRILLSDIKVHREQMDDSCQLFDPDSPEELSSAILNMMDDFEENVCEMKDQTENYAKALENVFQ